MAEERLKLCWIPVEATATDAELRIIDPPFPPRGDSDVSDLVSSMRIQGVITPLLLREVPGGLQIVCGSRRFRAAREAGIARLPALVTRLDDAEAIRCYVAEEFVRRPVDAAEEQALLADLRRLIASGKSRAAPDAAQRERAEASAAAAAGSVCHRESTSGSTRSTGATRGQAGQATVTGRLADAGRTLRAAAREAAGRSAPTIDLAPEGYEEKARRLLGRVEEIFAETLRRRMIPVERVEGIVDSLIELVREHPRLDLAFFSPRVGTADPTPTHCLQVAAWCARVAGYLGHEAGRARVLVLGGLLHDIGMIFVSDAALRSRPRERLAEQQFLRSHTRLGAAFVQAASAWEREVALCARDHHERPDGSGYPVGRRADELCPEARLVAVLDVFCSLVSPHIDRAPLSVAEAVERIERDAESGRLDATLVAALVPELTATSPATSRAADPADPPTTTSQNAKMTPENRLARTSAPVRLPVEERV